MVFRTVSGGSSGEDDFWRNEGLVGIELPGGGVGDWGVGIAAGGLINAGSALHAGDSGSIGPVVNDGSWHVATMVIDDLGNGTHDRRLYLDGAEVASDLALPYGGGSSVAANSSLFFGDYAPSDPNATKENFQGDIAHIRLDDQPLSPAEIATAHGDYLGTLVSTADTDGDGLPDSWELSWPAVTSLDELDGSALGPGPGSGTGDFDGDTLTDADEFEEGNGPDQRGYRRRRRRRRGRAGQWHRPDQPGHGRRRPRRRCRDRGWCRAPGPGDTGTDPLDPDSDSDGFINDGQEVAGGNRPERHGRAELPLGVHLRCG